MRFEVCYSTQFSMATFPRVELLPTDLWIIKCNFKIKEYKMPLLFSSPHPLEFVSLCHWGSLLGRRLLVALECLTLIWDSCSPPPDPWQVPSYLSSWPRYFYVRRSQSTLKVWVIWHLVFQPAPNVHMPHAHFPIKLSHPHWWLLRSFKSLFIDSIPAPASVQFSSRFCPLSSGTSLCELGFAPNLSNW